MGDLIPSEGNAGRSQFELLLELRFPAIAAEIGDCERGLLHCEMAVFARGTCAAIESSDFAQAQAHLDFVDELFERAAPELENAIYVSYLENVFLGSETEHYIAARRMLSARLRIALGELEDHWRRAGGPVDSLARPTEKRQNPATDWAQSPKNTARPTCTPILSLASTPITLSAPESPTGHPSPSTLRLCPPMQDIHGAQNS